MDWGQRELQRRMCCPQGCASSYVLVVPFLTRNRSLRLVPFLFVFERDHAADAFVELFLVFECQVRFLVQMTLLRDDNLNAFVGALVAPAIIGADFWVMWAYSDRGSVKVRQVLKNLKLAFFFLKRWDQFEDIVIHCVTAAARRKPGSEIKCSLSLLSSFIVWCCSMSDQRLHVLWSEDSFKYCNAGNFRQRKILSKATVRQLVRNVFSSNVGRRSFALWSLGCRSFGFCLSSHSYSLTDHTLVVLLKNLMSNLI